LCTGKGNQEKPLGVEDSSKLINNFASQLKEEAGVCAVRTD